MIVAPDFADHWKTRMLVDLLGGDEVAPVYLIRLWAHCQQRRTSVFESLPTAALRAICRYSGDAQAFDHALSEAGFISRADGKLVVVGWDEYNAALLANWQNGKRGGRPKKARTEPTDNQPETHGLPTGNPPKTHHEPIREDEIREEQNPPHTPASGGEIGHSKKRTAIAFKTFLEQCREAGERPIPENDSVFDYADKTGIPLDHLRLHWLEFKDRYGAPDAKRYKDWRTVYRKSVRGNWFRLWFLRGDGACGLTTQGEQARRQHQEAA
ncbi:hypothetical protein [Paraburkholderia ginsengisoli]|uniref:hypothetical protein n=1 Tax=Paraburkholderia ginsengisoli TaxID=311231 RepID=UPI001E38D498|nr:hypothetical protein [Paraburkholderia ginsengisoli]